MAKKAVKEVITIEPPNLGLGAFLIVGTAPYVQNAFSAKARDMMRATQEAGQTAKKGKKREPKDFMACYESSKHKSHEGWNGIPAPAFRAACISACRLCNFTMTRAKLSLFVMADGFDESDGTPLVKITKGEPGYAEHAVRLANGSADIRARAMWQPGWEATLRIRFDADQFTLTDVTNLLARVGRQVGIGEGRPDSKKSTGMGWGLFDIAESKEVRDGEANGNG